jgi:hypothetical protein
MRGTIEIYSVSASDVRCVRSCEHGSSGARTNRRARGQSRPAHRKQSRDPCRRVKLRCAGVSSVRNQKVTYRPMWILLILLATSRRSSTEWQLRQRAAQAEVNYSA